MFPPAYFVTRSLDKKELMFITTENISCFDKQYFLRTHSLCIFELNIAIIRANVAESDATLCLWIAPTQAPTQQSA